MADTVTLALTVNMPMYFAWMIVAMLGVSIALTVTQIVLRVLNWRLKRRLSA